MKIIVNGTPIEQGFPVKATKTQRAEDASGPMRTRQEAGPVRVTRPAPNTMTGVQLTNEQRRLIQRRDQLEGTVHSLHMRRRTLRGEITQLRERIRQLSRKVGRPVRD